MKSEYQNRLQIRQDVVILLEKRCEFLSFLRLFIFIVLLSITGIAFFLKSISYGWTLIPIGAFIVAMLVHDNIIRRKIEAEQVVQYYKSAISRINDEWQGNGVTRTDFVRDDHPYATDLDLFGTGSLFELLCTARSVAGEETLASWLTAPSSRQEILKRQEAVKELKNRLDLREDIFLCTGEMRSLVRPQIITAWANDPPTFSAREKKAWRTTFFGLAAAAIVSCVLAIMTEVGWFVLAIVILAQLIVRRVLKTRLQGIIIGVDGPNRELTVLSKLLMRIETEKVESAQLIKIKEALLTSIIPASTGISRLGRRVDWMEQGNNQLFAPIAFLLMWKPLFAFSIDDWRLSFGAHTQGWFDALGQFEAVCALSGYHYERPTDCFPTIVKTGPILEGTSLGHPLLPQEKCVRNSIALDVNCQIWVVSGSNMSGKSTFLRTVGVNAVLAMAGAPICGEALRMSPMSIGSTIRILDSLQGGKSRFFAEISCLKQIMNLADGPIPLLFLLDEILHGTNSHDRQIGADAIVRGLLAKGALGLVTTHDLAVADTARSLDTLAKNVHFDDQIKDGKLYFDYLLKDGVVKKSNALALMRSVGLPIG